MNDAPLYPLRFEPIYKSALWGGRRLEELLGFPLPGNEPIGEAWMLSDQGDNLSRVADGPLQGQTLRQLIERDPVRLLSADARGPTRFPLLLKFIDAQKALSVQVHPSDRHTQLLPPGERGKTEAWVILHAEPNSRIYAGLKRGVGPEDLRRALENNTAADCLHWFTPKPGDCVFIPAGTVHAIGAGVVLFEIQQTSDVTFRLYDWGRIDAKTAQPRQLHVEQAMACIDFDRGPCSPIQPVRLSGRHVDRRRLVDCEYFRLWRLRADRPFWLPASDVCRIVVVIEGQGYLKYRDVQYPLRRADVFLLPAGVGHYPCWPQVPLTLLTAQPK